MVSFYEVSEFVDDQVVYYGHWGLDETPIETNIVVHRAGTPAVTIVYDLCHSKLDAKLTGVLFSAGEDLFLRPCDIPIAQHFTAFGLMEFHEMAQLYEVDPANWTFLTGSQEEVKKTLAAWGMWAKPVANGQLDHPSRIFLVDPKGRIREVYSLKFFKPAWVVEDVELLLKERR